ncbi:MAG TPA: sigma-54 dependent transcriptional regulator [Bacteroidota bacterium]|nr:sigma-54 dependent transcriptional regulator [Bacteroidota bacterium]
MSENTIVFLTLEDSPHGDFWKKLSAGDFIPRVTRTPDDARELLLSLKPRVFVCIAGSPSDAFLDLLRFIDDSDLGTKMIVSVGRGSVDEAVRFMKAGAHDFLISHDRGDSGLVESILRTATNYRQTVPEKKHAGGNPSPGGDAVLVGQSPAICELRSAVSLIAKSPITVLITGESGTGKEVVARLIHNQSPRYDDPYVTINCAAIPKDVIENELFGHEKGAFTGALLKKAGCFELAHGGTILLDEIAEMSMETQAKLLRAIETQKFRRLGGKEEVNVDVRVIAATNRNVAEALKDGELREDLYYRLSVIELHIPPLRDRQGDIPMLVGYFFSLFSERYGKAPQRFSAEAMEILAAYEWPGNVRELRNAVERALVICPHEVIPEQYLTERITSKPAGRQHVRIPIGSSTQEAEKILILQTLASAGYNKAKAARILGVSRKTLHNKLSGF